jgi:hypothetical protein
MTRLTLAITAVLGTVCVMACAVLLRMLSNPATYPDEHEDGVPMTWSVPVGHLTYRVAYDRATGQYKTDHIGGIP